MKKIFKPQKKFHIVASVEEYTTTVINWLFPNQDITRHHFYDKVIQFVLTEKAPLFFVAQDEKEKNSFTTPYNIISLPPARGRYENPTVFSLTSLHEFFHALFGYPQNINQTTVDQFDEDMMVREAAASNATEVLIYYDLPSLRGQVREVFPIIWFDILHDQMGNIARPSVAQLLRLRRDWLRSSAYDWLYCKNDPNHPVSQFMSKWRKGNEIYWHKRLKQLLEFPRLQGVVSRSLSPTFYEEELENYSRKPLEQSAYERLQLQHVSLLYKISGTSNSPPQSFAELIDRREELENLKIMLG